MPEKSVLIRTIILALALVNNALALFGKSPLPIEDEQIETIVSMAFTLVSSLLAWWKNNSFTLAAKEGDKAMRRYRTLYHK